MPASRSRTENWRQTLEKVCERSGVVEIAIAMDPSGDRSGEGAPSSSLAVDLVWRVRLLNITDDELLIDEPSTLGEKMPIHSNVNLVMVFSLGQNRWMFKTQSIGRTKFAVNAHTLVTAIRLKTPTRVERCQRRQFYRVTAGGLSLPTAEARPLLKVSTARLAETAIRTRIEMLLDGQLAGFVGEPELLTLPEVGPPATTTIVNLGGGGVGLMVPAQDAGAFNKHRIFWVTMNLMPHTPAPLGIVCRLSHMRMDSEQRRYLGMSFEFGHNPGYKRFVVNTLCRCVSEIQRDQLRRRAQFE